MVREQLLRDLDAHRETPVVLIVGGAGYGKTTLLDQWCARSTRPAVRVPLRPRHDDGAALLVAVVDALETVEPLAPATRRRVVSPELDWSSVVLPALGRLLERRTVTCTLVLDDVHFLKGDAPRSVLDTLVHGLPDGWQLVLASRSEPEIGVTRLEADGRLWAIGPQQLLMTPSESAAVLRAMDLDLDADRGRIEAVIERTEGWPVALYLTALALQSAGTPDALDMEAAGDDVALARYLHAEILQRLDPLVREFLLRTSILEELEPALCDAVLGSTDSGAMLRALAAEQTFVRPVDRRGRRYRVHHLLRDLLRAELERDERRLIPVLHRRASEWYSRSGDDIAAVEHAIATGDDEYADAMVWEMMVLFLGSGLEETVRGWLDHWGYDERCRRPTLAVTSAWHALVNGDTASVRMWTGVVAAFPSGSPLPDGSPVDAHVALLRGLVAVDGMEAMVRDLEEARAGHSPARPLWSMVLMLYGQALRLVGRRGEAVPVLEESVALCRLINPIAMTHSINGLAHLAVERGDWTRAAAYADEMLAALDEYALDQRAAQCGPLSFLAYQRAHAGRADEARGFAKSAAFLVAMMVNLGPWLAVETHLDLAAAALLLGDVGEARLWLDEARVNERLVGDSTVLTGRIAELERALDGTAIPLGLRASAMTPAELRVLRYLPTHLTFGAIADELFVSRNTVKTQAISVYRKLGVSSRDAAVAEARRLGLLD